MKHIKTLALVAVGLAASAVASQAAIEINFVGLGDIQFKNASQFKLANAGSIFVVSSSAGSADSDFGSITAGPFSYGAITTDGAGNQSAPVITPAGTKLTIKDPWGGTLTGDLNWGTITTYATSGTGNISDGLTVNVSNLAYTHGATYQQVLVDFDAANTATLNLSFQFADKKTLTDLSTISKWTGTTYSASLVAVPEPSTYIAGLGALALFGLTAWPKRK